MTIKITIGLCVRNAENVVKDAIDSIINQDYPNGQMEILVVDGCSSDLTIKIIKKVVNRSSIKTKIFSENNGLGYARQVVVENAEGDYIVWVDADLILTKDYLKRQFEFMEKNPKVGVAGGSFGLYPGKTQISALENIVYFVESIQYSGGVYPRLVGTEGSIFRVKAVNDVGGFDINIKGAGEDSDLVYRIKEAGWNIYMTDTIFYEKCKEDIKELWHQYVWWGYGGYYYFNKYKSARARIETVLLMLPITGFIVGIFRSILAYNMEHRKIYFLLPFHYFFKRIAWFYGFLKGYEEYYGRKHILVTKHIL